MIDNARQEIQQSLLSDLLRDALALEHWSQGVTANGLASFGYSAGNSSRRPQARASR